MNLLSWLNSNRCCDGKRRFSRKVLVALLGTWITQSISTACSEITRCSWHRGCPPSWLSLFQVGSGERIWDVLIFICDAKEKNQPLYPGTAFQKSKNYPRIPEALMKALTNVSILLQILIGSQEPVQLQNKYNPKQMGKKKPTKKISKLRKVGERFQPYLELENIC